MKNTAYTIIQKAAALFAGAAVITSMAVPVCAEKETAVKETQAASVQSTMTPVSAAKVSFSDIGGAQYAWAQPYILEMADDGFITGYEDGTFRPDNEITRLECLALFSRLMGCDDEVNAPIAQMALDEYSSTLKSYALPWGQNEIAYLLYTGALKKSDLDTYLAGTEKNKAMKRYEAAIIITKSMGGEEDALSDLGVALSYADAGSIPSNAIQYVQYVTDAGIMNGMDDNLFSPDTPVLRSQMAVMLARTNNKTEYSFYQVRLDEVNTATRQITVTSPEGKEQVYVYSDKTEMKAMGETALPSDMTAGVQAVIKLSGKTLIGVDTLSDVPDATVEGKYKSMSTANGRIKIRVIPNGEKEAKTYDCAEDVSISFDGTPATMRSFKDGDSVTLEISGGKAVSVNGRTKTTTISNAKVESLDVDEDVTITISHGSDEYDGMTYVVADNVSVTKNSKTTDLRSIYAGDTVTLTIEYGEVKKISAVSKSSVEEGTIQAITISSAPEITVKVNGKEEVYSVTSDVEILINGEEGRLSDFSVGDTVKITKESNAVKKIVAESVKDMAGTATGVLTGVNTSYKVITIRKDNGEVMQFQCPDGLKTSTAYITAGGTIKKLSDLKADQSVEVKYSVSNGVYIATLVIIISE